MFKIRTLALLVAIGLPILPGCPKGTDTDNPAEGEVINPKQAFVDGVSILQTPDKNGRIDYQAAYSKFAAAAEAKPGYTKAEFNAGWTAERLGNFAAAEDHYRKALAGDAGYSAALFALGDVLSREGKDVEAVDVYRGYLDKTPGDLQARNSYMEALTGAKMYDEAITQAREILGQDNKNVGAYRNLSRIYFAKGEYKMSQLCAEKAKTMAEGDAGIYNNIGVTFLVMEDDAAAIAEFRTAVKLDPDNVEANLNLGYVALDSGDYALGQSCFEQALKGDPGNLDAKLGLAVALRGVKEYDRAGKLYDEILAADPTNEKAAFNAARMYGKYVQDYKKALKILEDYVNKANTGQIGPNHPVYAEIEQVKKFQAEKAERDRIIDDKKKAAEVAKKKAQEAFETLKRQVAELDKIMTDYGDCEMMVEAGATDLGMTVLEQAKMVVEAEETDMAGDVLSFFDELMPQIKQIVPSCPAPSATAPAVRTPPADAPPADAPAPEPPVEGAQ